MNTEMFLVLDFGGTKLTAATVTTAVLDKGQLIWRTRKQAFSPINPSFQTDWQTMRQLADAALDGGLPVAVGVSFGGPVDFETGIVRLSHHVPGWEGVPLAQQLTDMFGVPVWVDNDANVGALGEFWFGAGKRCDSLLYVTVSTGVGGGWVINGRSWRGHERMAGEIGHMMLDPNGPPCLCGKNGCVERLASGPYMAADAMHLVQKHPEKAPVLRKMIQEHGQLNGRHIAVAAASNDPVATHLLQRSAWAIGTAIGNTANLINPKRFILGGGITKSGHIWWNKVRQAAQETALPEIHFDIIPALLGDDAPLWGAVAMCLQNK